MTKWEQRYLFHARIVELLVQDAHRQKHEIKQDDPDAERKRIEITEKLRMDVKELSKYFFGKKQKETCALCAYPDFYFRYLCKKMVNENADWGGGLPVNKKSTGSAEKGGDKG